MTTELERLRGLFNQNGGCSGVPTGFTPSGLQIPGISCDGGSALVGIVADIVAGLICAAFAGVTPPATIACGTFAAIVGGIVDNVVQGSPWDDDLAVDGLIGGVSAGVFDELAEGIRRVRSLRAAARGLASACSFSSDTQVLMANGMRVAISEVEVGNLVLATDPETGETGPRQVTATWPHEDTLVDLVVSIGVITTTEDHEFWNATDQAWQESQHLDFGDELLTADGTIVTVEGLNWATAHYSTAYDLTVDDLHTFYVAVGGKDVLVHNCGHLRILTEHHCRMAATT